MWSVPSPSPSRTWATHRLRSFTHWPNGSASRWPSTRSSRAYVDQWDWEAVIRREDRTLSFLKNVVERIYAAIRRTEYLTCETYPQLKAFLPEKIHFIHAEELLKMYPDKTPKEREDAICEAYGAVFIIGIGGKLSNGEKHDGRAPDYDDWSTIAENGKMGLNGDILIWYPILGRSFELSSMGIRVDKESLLRQLKLEHKEEREQLYFHQQLLNDRLPLSIGGGIGQSRLCMVLLHKGHIGEIQASIWPDDMRRECVCLYITNTFCCNVAMLQCCNLTEKREFS